MVFFENISPAVGDVVSLSPENAAHAGRSLRMRIGEELIICDGAETNFFGSIASITKSEVMIEISKIAPSETELPVELTLFQCLPKGEKLELIVRQSVELGVSRFVPIYSANCVSRPADFTKKNERLQKISRAAASQSGRGIIPEILPLISFSEALEQADILFYENAAPAPLVFPGAQKIGYIVGAEGGFTPDEVALAAERGLTIASLGSRVLRAETAALAASAVISARVEGIL